MDALNLKHILVPIDFSKASLNALDTGIAMAKRQEAKLTLLHVINQNLMAHGHSETLPVMAPVIEVIRDEAVEMLEQLCEKIRTLEGLEVESTRSFGFVSSEICRVAEQSGADIVVMGTHGSSGFREFFIGTNAYAVVKHAPCPVLTVPPNQRWEAFSKILFPVRNTPGALEKYAFLRKIIRHNQAVLFVLGLSEDKLQTSNWVEEQVQQLNIELREDQVMHQTHLQQLTDRAATEVLETADREGANLIAITANLDIELSEFFIGPYTQQIVNHAKVPVLSIRIAKQLEKVQTTRQPNYDQYNAPMPGFAV